MSRLLYVADSHTAGEPTRVVLGGAPRLDGVTLAEKDRQLREILPELLPFLVGEPRGHAPMHAVLPQAPSDEHADLALLIVSALGSLPMCGHALIGAITTLMNLGQLPAKGPTTHVVVETLAGLIDVDVSVGASGIGPVRFTNAPSFVLRRNISLEVPEVGRVVIDLVYAGLWYAVMDVQQVWPNLTLDSVPRLVRVSHKIRRELNDHLHEIGLADQAPKSISQLLYVGRSLTDGADGRNMATSTELGFDRSPCGTGSCARMALMHARGELSVGVEYTHESVIGTRMLGRIEGTCKVGERDAVLVSIAGHAHLTALGQLVAEQDDPLGPGFLVPAASD